MTEEEQKKILETICKTAMEEVDILASYCHYLVHGEIKIIRKNIQ